MGRTGTESLYNHLIGCTYFAKWQHSSGLYLDLKDEESIKRWLGLVHSLLTKLVHHANERRLNLDITRLVFVVMQRSIPKLWHELGRRLPRVLLSWG